MNLKVHTGCVGAFLLEVVILTGQNRIQQDTNERSGCKTGEADCAKGDGTCSGVVDTDGQHQDQGCDQNVAALGEINMGLNQVPDSDCGNHSVKDQRNAADCCGGHYLNDCCEFRAEGKHCRNDCCQTNDCRIKNLGQCQNTGVLTIGCVCRSSEQRSQCGCKTIAAQSSVKSGILDIVLSDGGGDGGNITDVLHHRSKRDRNNCNNGSKQQTAVQLSAGED